MIEYSMYAKQVKEKKKFCAKRWKEKRNMHAGGIDCFNRAGLTGLSDLRRKGAMNYDELTAGIFIRGVLTLLIERDNINRWCS